MIISTETDPLASTSLAEDTLVRFRVWASSDMKYLEGPKEYVIGASDSCWWRLTDPTHQLSREHAKLAFDGTRWILTNLSKNGIHVGHVRHEILVVDPGVAFKLGSLTIVGEGEREIDLRGFLLRSLGYTRLQEVDAALQVLRGAIHDRKPVTLAGPGDLVPVAHALHRRMLKGRPFVVSSRGRQDVEESVRAAKNFQRARDAFDAAAGGSLCVVDGKLPADFDDVLAALAEPSASVQLFVCQRNQKRAGPAADMIVIPALADRRAEIDLVVQEYGLEAMAALEMEGPLIADDKQWVMKHCADSLADIEKGTLRIVALRKHRSKNGAGNALGMSHVALRKWLLKRSPLPFKIAG